MRLKLSAVVLSALCLLFAAACQGGGGNDGPPLPDLTPFTPDQAERVHAIRDEVAALRELPAADSIDEGSISRQQWQDYNAESSTDLSEEDQADLDLNNTIWRLMRLIGPDDDLMDLVNDTYGSIVVGFYDIARDTLVLVNGADGGDFSLSDESTIAHEYVHSFQDARYDLGKVHKRFTPDEGEVSEVDTTVNCVIEGDASVASDDYMAQEHGAGWQLAAAQLDDETMQAVQDLADIPPIILEYAYFNYDQCPAFVRAIQKARGWDGVDALYENPPTTSEQVMHPQKYLDGEGAVAVPDTDLSSSLGKDWKRGKVLPYGEFDVYAFFQAAGARPADAGRAADGWGGGRMALYRQKDGTNALVHITLNWDSRKDFDDFGLALRYILGWQGWHLDASGSDSWYWWDDNNDAGYALWDEQALQYDLIYATDATAAGIAKAALQAGLAAVAK